MSDLFLSFDFITVFSIHQGIANLMAAKDPHLSVDSGGGKA